MFSTGCEEQIWYRCLRRDSRPGCHLHVPGDVWLVPGLQPQGLLRPLPGGIRLPGKHPRRHKVRHHRHALAPRRQNEGGSGNKQPATFSIQRYKSKWENLLTFLSNRGQETRAFVDFPGGK